jgi:indolepyruvate ferredoxin oxidoreductase, beta subunit
MESQNIYLTGVGGQGIGLISEILLRAADHAGLLVKSVDTHGLAQRGGIVVSQIRIGDAVHTPIIPEGEADLVVSLERHEALRGMNLMLVDGGTLVYYNTVWQPLETRLNRAEETSEALVEETCAARNIKLIRVFQQELTDPRTQNVVVLAEIDRQGLVQGVRTEHYKQAMDDLMQGSMLADNLQLFDRQQLSA